MPSKGVTEVPQPGDPDRKRALNVLAQRRYRQRRRERIQALESQVNVARSKVILPEESATVELQPDVSQNFGIMTPDLSDEFLDLETCERQQSEIDTSSASVLPVTEGSSSQNSGLLDFDIFLFSPPSDFSAELQNLEGAQFTFPDDGTLSVPELQVMTAGLNIAEILGCADTIWDFSTLRIFDLSSIPTPNIPPNLAPTEIQRKVPHHPLFDIIPWPTVRTKLICVFAQPVQTRPPVARDPMALMQLVYDMEDPSDGLRVSGEDWYDGNSWEVGQAFFRNWWWVLDRSVVDHSNYLRAKRGAKKLILESP